MDILRKEKKKNTCLKKLNFSPIVIDQYVKNITDIKKGGYFYCLPPTKIISRLIFDNIITNTYNYEYKVFDNGKLLFEISEDAFKSKKAHLKNDRKKTPSTGDVNVIDLGEGIHNITIENSYINRELMFRFYVSKNQIKKR